VEQIEKGEKETYKERGERETERDSKRKIGERETEGERLPETSYPRSASSRRSAMSSTGSVTIRSVKKVDQNQNQNTQIKP